MFLNYRTCSSVIFFLFILHSSCNSVSIFSQPKQPLEADIRLILDRHNQYRTCHHVPPLVIDPRLTKEAQRLANALASKRINVDQARKWRHGNIFVTPGNLQLEDFSNFGFNPVDKWYNEVKFYFEDRSRTDHFTRIVWKESKKLGVGISQDDKGFVYVVCKYDPEGNIPGLYDKNIVIPDKKMIHASDVCMLPQMTSPYGTKNRNTTLVTPETSTVMTETGPRLKPESAISASDKRIISSSTIPNDGVTVYTSVSATATTNKTDKLNPLLKESDSPHASSVFDSSSITSTQAASVTESSYSTASQPASKESTHLGSIIWSRIWPSSSTAMPSSISTHYWDPSTTELTLATTRTAVPASTQPASSHDLSATAPAKSSLSPVDTAHSTSSITHDESTPTTPILVDVFPSVSSQSESGPQELISTSEPPPFSITTSISVELGRRVCNASDTSGNLSCILPDRPRDADDADTQQIVTPSSNQTMAQLDLPSHEFANETADDSSSLGQRGSRTQYLRVSLLLAGLLAASLSAVVSLLAVFALFKLFVCCKKSDPFQEAPSSSAAQMPSHLVSVIPTSTPHQMPSPLSPPASPVFQRTILTTKLY